MGTMSATDLATTRCRPSESSGMKNSFHGCATWITTEPHMSSDLSRLEYPYPATEMRYLYPHIALIGCGGSRPAFAAAVVVKKRGATLRTLSTPAAAGVWLSLRSSLRYGPLSSPPEK